MVSTVTYIGYQHEIYAAGQKGNDRAGRSRGAELERRASEQLLPGPWGYIAGGAGRETTDHANRAALDELRIIPRMLGDVSSRALRRSVLGLDLGAPVVLAPIGVQTLAHPEGELASARAAAGLEVPNIASSASSYTLEEIAHASGSGPRWFQPYWPRSSELVAAEIAPAS